MLGKLGQNQGKPIIICCDNGSAIELSKNLVMLGRCKHIDVCFHFLRELTKAGDVKLMHWDSREQLDDLMTNVTPQKYARISIIILLYISGIN